MPVLRRHVEADGACYKVLISMDARVQNRVAGLKALRERWRVAGKMGKAAAMSILRAAAAACTARNSRLHLL